MIAAIFVMVLGAGALAAGVGYVRAAHRMRGFQVVRGRITDREVYDDPNFPNPEARFGDGGGFSERYRYTYVVDGTTYTGDKLGYGSRGYKRSVVEQRLAAMPDDVEVHYNPSDPSEAYLRLNKAGGGWWLIALGVVLVLGALVALLG